MAAGLSFLFWSGLYAGGGLIGGDLYSYYFPQKTFLADQLQAGTIPLWNPLVGFGYPVIAESQTGALYPANLIAYSLLGPNAAYNAVQIVHYWLAFLFCWMYARRIGLSTVASLLTATVYTYAWFPPRICWEWAIIGGAWFPLVFWSIESFVQKPERGRRSLSVLVLALAAQLLAGHFTLAFITQLTAACYAAARILWGTLDKPDVDLAVRVRRLLVVAAAFLLAMGLSAAQLAPTWELKTRSQRSEVGQVHDPDYGRIPVWYWSQFVFPWMWYPNGPGIDVALSEYATSTNMVEAHLYFGMIPLAMAFIGLASRFRRQRNLCLTWSVLGLLALLYAAGLFLPVTRHVPGFNFFIGTGRYGIVTTIAVALFAGFTFDDFIRLRLPTIRWLLTAVVFMVTIAEFWLVSGWVTYAVVIENPPLASRDESPLRKLLLHANAEAPVRLFSRGANVATLLGVAATPVYLGLGPAEYWDPKRTMPEPLPFDESPTPEHIDWLRQSGVTHVLSFRPLDVDIWPVRPVWSGYDPMLNRAWAHSEPLNLYELLGSRGRVLWEQPGGDRRTRVTSYQSGRVEIEADSSTGGLLVLTDLHYPGWNVSIDGEPAESRTVDGLFRGVEVPAGKHRVEWVYRPRVFWFGLGCSALCAVIGIVLCLWPVFRRDVPAIHSAADADNG